MARAACCFDCTPSPDGFMAESVAPAVESQEYGDVPWFMFDHRRRGYLGRMLPAKHPAPDLRASVHHWSAAANCPRRSRELPHDSR